MAKAKVLKTSDSSDSFRPAILPENRELQLISLAMDSAEKQLREGTASSQVITHFLKLGCSKAELEKEKLRYETKKMEAQIAQIQSIDENRKIAEEAIKAMRRYQGIGDVDEYDDY